MTIGTKTIQIQIPSALRVSVCLPLLAQTLFLMSADTITEATVRLSLRKEESAAAERGETDTYDITPSAFLAMALDIEDAQYVFGSPEQA
jgi:hypothetical protein